MEERGWEQLDFIFVSGDAYVDHPSFGPAILCRLLENMAIRWGLFLSLTGIIQRTLPAWVNLGWAFLCLAVIWILS